MLTALTLALALSGQAPTTDRHRSPQIATTNPTIAKRQARRAAQARQAAIRTAQARQDAALAADAHQRQVETWLEHERAMAPLRMQAQANAIAAQANAIQAQRNQILGSYPYTRQLYGTLPPQAGVAQPPVTNPMWWGP